MRTFSIGVALAYILGSWSCLHAAPHNPNIVIILADDYGYGSAGCYGADGKLVRTPNIDRLAREGRRFTDANTTSSVCSPTRYSVITGRYCWRTPLKHEVLNTFAPLHIELTRLTIASLLKGQGYHTASVGKWHLGYGEGDSTPKWRADFTAELTPGPLDIGFDYHFSVPSNHGDLTGVFVENRFVYGLRSGKIPPGMRLPGPVPDDDNFKATYTRDDTEGKKADPIDIDAPRRVNDRVMPVLTDKVVHWIEQQQAGTPFFLYFTPVAVHNPVTPEKDLAGKSAAGLYGDWIHELDRTVGRVLEVLDKKGFAQDTLLIFSSDNGGVKEPARTDSPQTLALNAGLAINGALRGGKHHVWEGGFKVPFIVRWPGKAPAGTVCTEMVSLADLLATTAAVVGAKLPPAEKAAEDSYNILPAILGDSSAQRVRADMIVHSSDGVFAIRKGPWKWIEGVPVDEIKAPVRKAHADEFRPQLYNVQDDPAETTDVSAAHPEVVKELQSLLERYREGGYSRELPPAPAKPKTTATELLPLSGQVVLNDALARVPGEPWVQVRGKWAAKDSALWASQKPGEQQPAALRAPLAITDGAIQYELSLPAATVHTVRVQCQDRNHVFRIEVSSHNLTIIRNATDANGSGSSDVLTRQPVKLQAGTWYPIRITFAGGEVKVQIAGVTATASQAMIAEPKTSFALMAAGSAIGFRKLAVAK
jgi:arylsulfatase A